jgi:hypothetical protein
MSFRDWQTEHTENGTQKLESTNLGQAFDKEYYLFFQVSFEAR